MHWINLQSMRLGFSEDIAFSSGEVVWAVGKSHWERQWRPEWWFGAGRALQPLFLSFYETTHPPAFMHDFIAPIEGVVAN